MPIAVVQPGNPVTTWLVFLTGCWIAAGLPLILAARFHEATY
jgi:hypothetical protein